MKTTFLKTVAAVLTLSSLAMADKKLEKGSYPIDTMHSKVGFEVSHLVIASVSGTFKTYAGQIEVAEKFTDSKVTADIDVKSIDTGVEKRDDHLRSADFFDVAKNAKMAFKSTAIKGTQEKFEMTGDLTIKGITKKVTFDGKFLGTVIDGYGNQKIAFNASAKIKRQDFGLKWNQAVEAGPIVGDEVTIDLKIQGGRPAPKKTAGL